MCFCHPEMYSTFNPYRKKTGGKRPKHIREKDYGPAARDSASVPTEQENEHSTNGIATVCPIGYQWVRYMNLRINDRYFGTMLIVCPKCIPHRRNWLPPTDPTNPEEQADFLVGIIEEKREWKMYRSSHTVVAICSDVGALQWIKILPLHK